MEAMEMSGRRHGVRQGLSAMLVGVVSGSVVCSSIIGDAQAQEKQPDRLVDKVSPSLLVERTLSLTEPDKIAEASPLPRRGDTKLADKSSTLGDRLVGFEQEYGMEQESSSALGRIIQAAKYGLDKMCFAAQETARKLEFCHDIGAEPAGASGSGSGQSEYSLPMFGRFGHAQLRSEVTVHDSQTGEAFIGLKLAIPFGAGGRESPDVPQGRPTRRESNG
jgi:hypothetical protein